MKIHALWLQLRKQTFSIPGSVILNLIAGRIYSTYFAFPLVCTLTMIGASSCYILSKTTAKRALMLCCSERIKSTGKSMEAHRSDMLWYMTFLRLIPMSPNWLINVTAPIVGVPFGIFAASVFIGLMPYNFSTCLKMSSFEWRRVNKKFPSRWPSKCFHSLIFQYKITLSVVEKPNSNWNLVSKFACRLVPFFLRFTASTTFLQPGPWLNWVP